MQTVHDQIVFCDFDGTVTMEDGFLKVCYHFAPEESRRQFSLLKNRSTTLRKSIYTIVESLPSNIFPEILDFVRQARIRPGFETFLDFLEERKTPLVIISGGLKALVEVQLGSLTDKVENVYAADVDLRGEFIRIVSPFENERELVDKNRIMETYDYTTSIVVGDGMTDYRMAMAADRVFARRQLAEYLTKQGISHHTFEDFLDIRDRIQNSK